MCSFVGQWLPLPLVPANQEQLRRELGLFPGAMLWTMPPRPRLRTPVMQEALSIIRRVYFEERSKLQVGQQLFLHAATTRSPASIHYPPSLGLTAYPLTSGYGPSASSS